MKLLFLLLGLTYSSALPLQDENRNFNNSEELERADALHKMKVESPRLDYMIELQSTLADQNGKPKVRDLAAYPTSVFCLPDYDIVHNNSRNGTKSQSRCSSVYNFLFEWESGEDERRLPLGKACVRVFMEVINRLVPEDENAKVNVSVKLTPTDTGKDSLPPLYFSDEWSFIETLDVAVNTDGWLELDITEPLEIGWDPTLKSGTVGVTLKFDVDCNKQRKVPLKIINPATVEQFARRERQLVFQPFLVVYIDDIQIKKILEGEQWVLPDDKKIRTRRDTLQDDICHMDNFTVVFSDLKLRRIIYPSKVNIRRCVGNCTLQNINKSPSLATNHAKLMISAHTLYHDDGLHFDVEPLLPCCSAGAYSPIYLLYLIESEVEGILEVRLFPDFIVEKCGCW